MTQELYLPPHGSLPSVASDDELLPCTFCGTLTKRKVLATLGARCGDCYERYVREKQSYPDVGNKKANGPKDWASALKRREEAGERLSIVQRQAWRDALRNELTEGK